MRRLRDRCVNFDDPFASHPICAYGPSW